MASLEHFGQRRPIVVNRRNKQIEAGNATHEAAKRLGWESIAVVWVTDDKKAQLGFSIADNRTAELAGWSEDELAAALLEIGQSDEGLAEALLLDELATEQGIDLTEPGAGDLQDPEPQIDRAAELQKEWGTELGQLWTIEGKAGEHRILCGDATKAGDVGMAMGGTVPFLMVTDPPYGVKYDPQWRKEAGVNNSDRMGDVQNDDRASWAAAYRLFPGDVAYVWHAAKFGSVVERSIQAIGFEIRAQIIWVKRRFAISRGHYHWRHEPCIYAVRKSGKARFSGGRRQQSVWADIIDRWNPSEPLFASLIQEDTLLLFEPNATTVWAIGQDAGEAWTPHGTQKPLECMARPIRNHGKEGDSVYDPFLGSGTTLVACEQLSRRGVGIEISPAYTAVCLQRLADMGLEPRLA